MRLRLSADEKTLVEQALGGRNAEDLRAVPARATFAVGGDEDRARLASFRAAGFPAVTDGVPTILRATAWLAHEGENRNELVFVKEELPRAAEKIREPNFLIMDFNHSSMRASEHPPAIGLWYRAAFAFDPHARGLTGDQPGAWGILLQGISWAWAFPTYAAELIAEQERHGAVRFSMGCLPTVSEFVTGADGRRKEIAHDPVFFALSALNVPHADPDAWGFMTDNDNATQDLATETLLVNNAASTAAAIPTTNTLTAGSTPITHYVYVPNTTDLPVNGIGPITWVTIPSTTVTTDASPRLPTPKEPLLMADNTPVDATALTTKVAELAAANETLKADLAKALETATAAGADVETLTTKLAELETARDGLKSELAASITLVEQYKSEVAAFMAERQEREKAQFEAAKKTKLAERVEALPDAFKAAHVKRDEAARTRVEAKWAEMTDEQWETYKTDELLVGFAVASESTAGMFLRKSREEGQLPLGAGGEQNSRKARIRALLNK